VIVLLLVAAGAGLLVAAELSTVIEIRVGEEVRDSIEGRERHGWALVPLAVLALPMGVGAALGRSRAAALALVALGLIAAVIALVGDLPDLDSTGLIGSQYEDAEARGRSGFWFEVAGAASLVSAGTLAAVRAGS
jgi:hypothetical protein